MTDEQLDELMRRVKAGDGEAQAQIDAWIEETLGAIWGRFVFVVKSDGRRSSTGVGVACQAIDFIGFPVDFFDRRLRAQKRARFQPPVPVFGVVCDGRISLA